MDLKKICKQVCEITIEAGIFVKENINKISEKNIDRKGVHDFVTYVDKTTEKFLVDKLMPLVPGAGFIVEEKTVDIKGDI
jgi:myo-inositol-1(or 4)-monophosphatase